MHDGMLQLWIDSGKSMITLLSSNIYSRKWRIILIDNRGSLDKSLADRLWIDDRCVQFGEWMVRRWCSDESQIACRNDPAREKCSLLPQKFSSIAMCWSSGWDGKKNNVGCGTCKCTLAFEMTSTRRVNMTESNNMSNKNNDPSN